MRKFVDFDCFIKEGTVIEGENEGGDWKDGEKEKESKQKKIYWSLL